VNGTMTANNREPLHLRRITCEGFLRKDGLIDIEGTLIDTKHRDFQLANRLLPAKEQLHQMRICITVNHEREIVAVQASIEHSPYNECQEVEPFYQRLVGMRVDRGFVRAVKEMFRGTSGCTHMTELLAPLATTTYQVIWAEDGWNGIDDHDSQQRASPLNGCHALKVEGQVVKTYFRQELEQWKTKQVVKLQSLPKAKATP